ncbi:sulfite oxidase heme-binding subunit YedZ [Rhodobacter sp. 24-YEA-8]|uniref:sulfite oxidase heme-binding subunit YedZ n=1 Tax=Rhodobacter sp. 24-YEA-8 TaxID=1884310 RepID=UPI000897625D|nr:protein-methionine-sulfoxide reductase heme-binding subunit MsrQ [Rhodobacter sp. 24-YEA-8]SEC55436.1 sulfoxide reductase heme-binding subunit YedZ [Rhodobacter sp. 24-YEA-8]
MKPLADALNILSRRLPEWGVWILGLVPLVWLAGQVVSGSVLVDPVKAIEHDLGKTGLWLLFICLAIPPLRALTGVNLIRHRRAVGLLAFFYIALHLLAWIWLDMGLLIGQALADLVRRPYLFMGIAAFLMLVPLAVTSNAVSIRRMGRNWRRLHLLIWPATILAVLHYLWQMKIIRMEGWIWAGILVGLLIWRLSHAKIRARR